jgi:hypothetical protein
MIGLYQTIAPNANDMVLRNVPAMVLGSGIDYFDFLIERATRVQAFSKLVYFKKSEKWRHFSQKPLRRHINLIIACCSNSTAKVGLGCV